MLMLSHFFSPFFDDTCHKPDSLHLHVWDEYLNPIKDAANGKNSVPLRHGRHGKYHRAIKGVKIMVEYVDSNDTHRAVTI